LFSAAGVAGLVLGFGAARRTHRAGAAVVALIGAAVLVRATPAIVAALQPPRLAQVCSRIAESAKR
jgi:hypothetical protein